MIQKTHQITAFDIADYILLVYRDILGYNYFLAPNTLNTMLYFCQAKHLQQIGKPFFLQRLKSRPNHPAIPKLEQMNASVKEAYQLTSGPGNFKFLDRIQRKIVEQIVERYGKMSIQDMQSCFQRDGPMILACYRNNGRSYGMSYDTSDELFTPILYISEIRDYHQNVTSKNPTLTKKEWLDKHSVAILKRARQIEEEEGLIPHHRMDLQQRTILELPMIDDPEGFRIRIFRDRESRETPMDRFVSRSAMTILGLISFAVLCIFMNILLDDTSFPVEFYLVLTVFCCGSWHILNILENPL